MVIVRVLIFTLISLITFSTGAKAQKTQSKSNDDSQSKQVVSKDQKKPKLSQLEQGILDEINDARKNPQKFVQYLESYKKSLKNNLLILPDGNRVVMTEGLTAIDDAIDALKQIAQIEEVSVSNGLTSVAAAQIADLREDSTLGHKGKDGSLLDVRMLKLGTVGADYAENISYGADKSRDVVMSFIIDDGVKSRAHRKNIFSTKFSLLGISCDRDKTGKNICVAEFANFFRERQKPLGSVKVF